MACVQKYSQFARGARQSGFCADENRAVIDWKVLRRELVIARIKAGLEEHELAIAIGVDVSTIYRIEKSGSGKNNPSLDVIAKWAEGCGLTLMEFLAVVDASEPAIVAQVGSGKTAVMLEKVAAEVTETTQDRTEPPEIAAQLVSAAPSHGPTRDVPPDLEIIMREMREATTELRLALAYAATITGKAVGEPSRQAAKARAALARKRKRARKNRRKGAGTA